MELPNDYTPEELEIYHIMMNRVYQPTNTAYIYRLIEDPIDKFLLVWVFELGKTRRSAQIALNLSKATIWKRIKVIKKSVAVYAKDKHLIDNIDKI